MTLRDLIDQALAPAPPLSDNEMKAIRRAYRRAMKDVVADAVRIILEDRADRRETALRN